jgi:hypothetical protein
MPSYLSNLWDAIQGKPTEGFQDSGSGPRAYMGIALIATLVSLLPMFLFAFGSARLSWCLNHSYGWSILCFFFPGFYYPYYSLILNPLCNVTPSTMSGGRRR